MSEMTLRMPSSYVSVEKDEMDYVDGGIVGVTKYVSRWFGFDLYLSSKTINRIGGVAALASAITAGNALLPEPFLSKLAALGAGATAVISGAIYGVSEIVGGGEGVILRFETIKYIGLIWAQEQ